MGGGYPEKESGLSNMALKWMLDELAKLGVHFKEVSADWHFNEAADEHRPWESPLFAALGVAVRVMDRLVYGLEDHASLVARLAKLGR